MPAAWSKSNAGSSWRRYVARMGFNGRDRGAHPVPRAWKRTEAASRTGALAGRPVPGIDVVQLSSRLLRSGTRLPSVRRRAEAGAPPRTSRPRGGRPGCRWPGRSDTPRGRSAPVTDGLQPAPWPRLAIPPRRARRRGSGTPAAVEDCGRRSAWRAPLASGWLRCHGTCKARAMAERVIATPKTPASRSVSTAHGAQRPGDRAARARRRWRSAARADRLSDAITWVAGSAALRGRARRRLHRLDRAQRRHGARRCAIFDPYPVQLPHAGRVARGDLPVDLRPHVAEPRCAPRRSARPSRSADRSARRARADGDAAHAARALREAGASCSTTSAPTSTTCWRRPTSPSWRRTSTRSCPA